MVRKIRDALCIVRNSGSACILASLFLISQTGIAQTVGVSHSRPQRELAEKTRPASSQIRLSRQAPTVNLGAQDWQTPKQVVKVLFDPDTNRLTLVGSPEDIAIVKRAILDLQKKFGAQPGVVMERVPLTFQMADSVAEILSTSMRLEANGNGKLKVDPVHFPESILLTGPTSLVERAKRLIEKVDSHPDFPSDSAPSHKTADSKWNLP